MTGHALLLTVLSFLFVIAACAWEAAHVEDDE